MIELKIESCIWYGLAIFVAGSRFISRSLLFGSPLGLKIDDFIILFAVAPYTALVVCMNIVATKNSNLLPPGVDVTQLTEADIQDRILGSKFTVVVEQMQVLTIWTIKATLVIMYYRLTVNLAQNLIVKFLAVYVAVGFVVMEILYFAVWCRPFYEYWSVPTNDPQCDAATNHLITNAVLNISSDLIMLGVGFSLAIKSKLPWKRRIIVHAIFALGTFVIIAAAMNKYYSFVNPFGAMWTFWYVREASTALIVANLPFCWTLIRRVFKVGAFNEEQSSQAKSARVRREKTHSRPRHHVSVIPGEKVTHNSTDNGRSQIRHDSVDKDSQQTHGAAMKPPVDLTHAMPPRKRFTRGWKELGVYGKNDMEALGSDMEDIDEDPKETILTQKDATANGQYHDMVLNDVDNLGDVQLGMPLRPSSVLSSPTSSILHLSLRLSQEFPDPPRRASLADAPALQEAEDKRHQKHER